MSARHNRKEYQRVAEFVCVCVRVCVCVCWAANLLSKLYVCCLCGCVYLCACMSRGSPFGVGKLITNCLTCVRVRVCFVCELKPMRRFVEFQSERCSFAILIRMIVLFHVV